jgi:predicted RND superfamily exporter protein
MRRNKLRWIALGIAALIFAGAGLSRISFNIDILKLLPSGRPEVEGLSLFVKNFAQPNELIVTVEDASPDDAEADANLLADAFAKHPDIVKRAVARPPWEKNPAGLSELLACLVLDQPPEKIRELVATLAPDKTQKTLQDTLDKLAESVSPQEIALRSYDPFNLAAPLADAGVMSGKQQSEFSSADGTFRVIYVESAKPFKNYKDTIAWMKEIRRIVADASLHARKVGYTGEPAFVADISGSMEWDMMSSGFVTLFIIAIIFWLCYRRARPLADLQAMLVLIFTLSLATAGLFLSQLTVIGVGCAAIMIGLSVDYGFFVYQRAQRHTGTVRELQRQCFQNIAWTSGTTAAAFFALNLSSLPGLSQLGNLVGIGVVIGAFVMLGIFAPLTMRFHRHSGEHPTRFVERLFASPRFLRGGAVVAILVVAVLLGALVIKGPPGADFTARSLRPRHSEAYPAMDRLYKRLTDDRGLLSLVVSGKDEDQVLARLRDADSKLAAAKTHGDLRSYRTALPLWPVPENQRANLPILAPLIRELPRLKKATEDAGFKDEAFALTESVIRQWAAWSTEKPPIWPENETSHWLYRRAAVHANGHFLALGMVEPVPGKEDALVAAVESPGVYLVSWNLLGSQLKHVIPAEFRRVIIGLLAILLFLLALAFRSARALALFVLTSGLVLVCLAGAMTLLGMTWNFFNLAAILLLLGTGTDYSILLLLAMKRNGGDAPAAQRELGLVICLCVASASSGFGTISWANNMGLASLGQTCAMGLLIDALISVFLLPPAWELLHGARRKTLSP